MPNETSIQRRRRHATATGVTSFRSDFTHMCKRHPQRIGIVTEGDSWFDYPRRWLLFGPDINVVHHIEDKIVSTKKVNLLRMASNGDEAQNMMSGKHKEQFESVLKRNSKHIDLILFSGGGNDIVGKKNLPPLLNQYEDGFTAQDCIKVQAFNAKLDSIMDAYSTLVSLRDQYTPQAHIVTHCYDISAPSEDGAVFLWGLIKIKPWIYPFLVEKNIPESLHLTIVEILLREFKARLSNFADAINTEGKMVMVDTQGILRPGNKDDWLNEIHPSESGFKKVSVPIYEEMKKLLPALP